MKHTKLLYALCSIAVLQCMLGLSTADNITVTYYRYGDLSSILWSGQHIVFMRTTANVVYRSTDEGKTWEEQFQKSTDTVADMHQDPIDDKKLIFIADGGRRGWTTVDAGANYLAVSFAFPVRSVQFNPNITTSLLLADQDAKGCATFSCNYYVSNDFGHTTSQIGKNWMDASWNTLENGAPFTTVFALDSQDNFGYASGGGFTTLFKNTWGFVFTKKHLFVAVADSAKWVVLKVCSGGYTDTANYHDAQFPFGELPRDGFAFLDDTTGSQWIGLFQGLNWGHIYTSDASGLQYVTALKHNFHDGHYFDFDVFHGLEGIYLANILQNPGSGKAVRVTQVTFDNGGEWRKLAAPKDSYCTGSCSLHLHGMTDYMSSKGTMSPFYSTENAIGLFLATGNIGEKLETNTALVNLYLSRDAGLTWMELAKGSHIYEFGDHGGIIVFARNDVGTKEVKYTLDEGLTVGTIELDNPVNIENIVVEPSATSYKFILYGEYAGPVSITIGLDFGGVHPRTCVDADYETWSPTDGRANNETCQLGRTVTYVRRRRDAKCFNDRETEHIQSIVNCQCDIEDYECDFGFEESFVDGKYVCVVDTRNPPADPPSNCPPGTKYKVSSGRRLVAGDSCVNELPQFAPTMKTCPDGDDSNGKSNKALVAVVIIFVLFAVIGIAGFFVYRNEEWREKFLSVVGKVIPINRGQTYSRLGRQMLASDEEFAIGGDQDLDDSDVEEDAPELQDHDIQRATSRGGDFNPRT